MGETGLRGQVGIPLDSKHGHRPSSQDEMDNTVLISSCVGKLGIPLELRQVSRGTSRVAKSESSSVPVAGGNLGLLSSRFRVNGLSLALRDEFGGFSCIAVESEGSSCVATGTSGNLSCVLMGVRHPFGL